MVRMATIVDPRGHKLSRNTQIGYRDYIPVPAIELRGTRRVIDMLSPEQLALLAVYTNTLEKRRTR